MTTNNLKRRAEMSALASILAANGFRRRSPPARLIRSKDTSTLRVTAAEQKRERRRRRNLRLKEKVHTP